MTGAQAGTGKDATAPVMSALDVTKTYGGTHALRGVSLAVRAGSVTAMFGENGAGKSTLMKVLAGIEQPTSGSMLLDGEAVEFVSSRQAADHGVVIIHQELSLCPNLCIQDNLFLAQETTTRLGVVDRRTQHAATSEEESLDIADDVAVLRDGELVATASAAEADLGWVVRNMVGRDQDSLFPKRNATPGDVVMSVRGVMVADPSNAGRLAVDGLDLELCAGEIVGVYGLMASGRTEPLEALAGRLPLSGGSVLFQDEDLDGMSLRRRAAAGIALVPEDRQRDGLVQTMTVGENFSLR